MKIIATGVLILTLIGTGLFFQLKAEKDSGIDVQRYYDSRGKMRAPAPVKELIGKGI